MEEEIHTFDVEDNDNNNNWHGTSLWKILAIFVVLIVLLFGISALTCAIANTCRNYVPTVQNMLTSPFAVPFVVSGMNAVWIMHLIIVVGIYSKTAARAPIWARFQVLEAVFVYASVAITALVFPWTGWSGNWANVAIIVNVSLWMIMCTVCVRGIYRDRISSKRHLVWWNVGCAAAFIVSSIGYVIVRAVGTSTGVLVTEIVCGLTFMMFMVVCAAHVSSVKIQIES